ncbi:MAG: hypothetical protein M5R36_05495 [Deltaproteobacteria bacterium]|nr:hypothetical protein [Deltaproteobacteria bacterium]
MSVACRTLDSHEMLGWGRRTWERAKHATGRRVAKIGDIATRIGQVVVEEGHLVFKKAIAGQLQVHFAQRTTALKEYLKHSTHAVSASGRVFLKNVALLKADPVKAAPDVFAPIIGFLIGSGGLDGDGGLPDLDLKFGIGAHRSVMTHSILMGAAAEVAILSLLDLTLLTHSRLPSKHDPLWDKLEQFARPFAANLIRGTDAGIALHLAVDGTIDGMTPFKDLPFSMPLEGHRLLILANAAGELGTARDKNVFDRVIPRPGTRKL